MLAGSTDLAVFITAEDCCFESCATTTSLQDGAAFYISGTNVNGAFSLARLNITNCGFFNCHSARNGGIIYFHGQQYDMTNVEISRCDAIGDGIVYININKIDYGYSAAKFQYIDIHDCTSNGAIWANTISPDYFYMNITNCRNNDMSSTYPVCFKFAIDSTYNSFMFQNFVRNTGNIILQYENPQLLDNINDIRIHNFNFLENTANILFKIGINLHHMSHISMFGNIAASPSGLIAFSAINTTGILKLQNCYFDMDEATVKANLPNFQFDSSNCYFSVADTQTFYFSYADHYAFPNPFGCIPRIPPSEVFTYSSVFTVSSYFTSSSTFSNSMYFTETSSFSKSITFSSSSSFSQSLSFTKSSSFLPTSSFTISLTFSASDTFTKSSSFSKSSTFSLSLSFSKSHTFSPSLSKIFSRSDMFTQSLSFSPSDSFTSSSEFTSSFHFSPSINVRPPTNSFSPSDSFTPSNFFTPNRTKYPDGMMKEGQADVRGEYNPFSKEELKKAAAPATISLAVIITSIVMTILYIRRKVKQVMNYNNIPNFDIDDDDDTDYSYSFYTYEYYYSDSCSEKAISQINQSKFETGDDLLDADQNQSASYDEFTDENLDFNLSF